MTSLTLPAWSDRPGWIEPRTATPRDTNFRTFGHRLDGYSHAFGHDRFWGWVHQVFDVALEIDAEGAWRYRTITVIVGRQSTKTTGLLAARAMVGLLRGEKVSYSAQNRVFGREKFLEILECLEVAMPGIRVNRGKGEEKARLLSTGGEFRLVTPTSKGARSFTCDVALIDEAAYIPAEYLAALRPTMVTRDAQIWMVSSAGDDTSQDLARARAAGHACIKSGQGDTAVFEWGCEPDDNFADRAVWAASMPTLGLRGGARWEALEDDWKNMTPKTFAREYLGIWDNDPLDTPISSDIWSPVQTGQIPAVRSTVLAADTAPDQSSSSLALAGFTADDKIAVRLLAFGEGDAWLPGELDAAWAEFSPLTLTVDEATPAGSLIVRQKQLGRPVEPVGAQELIAACAGLVTRCQNTEIVVQHDEDLTTAALAATRRTVSNGWAFDRRKLAIGDEPPAISPVVAAALAVHERAKMPTKPAATVVEDRDPRQDILERLGVR